MVTETNQECLHNVSGWDGFGRW